MSDRRHPPKEDTIFDACRRGDVDRIEKYVANKGSVLDADVQKMTLLHHAAFGGHVAILKLILSQEPSLDAIDTEGWTPLTYAADRGHAECAAMLLDQGANVNARDELKRTPLHMACNGGHIECVKLLLANGANINIATVAGWKPRKYAEERKDEAVLALFPTPAAA